MEKDYQSLQNFSETINPCSTCPLKNTQVCRQACCMGEVPPCLRAEQEYSALVARQLEKDKEDKMLHENEINKIKEKARVFAIMEQKAKIRLDMYLYCAKELSEVDKLRHKYRAVQEYYQCLQQRIEASNQASKILDGGVMVISIVNHEEKLAAIKQQLETAENAYFKKQQEFILKGIEYKGSDNEFY